MNPLVCLLLHVWRTSLLVCVLSLLLAAPGAAERVLPLERRTIAAELTTAAAAALFGAVEPVEVVRDAGDVPGWTVRTDDGTLLGYVGSTWEIARSVGYSGRPIEMLVAISPSGTIVAAELVRHAEPILTLGLSDEDIARFVGAFAGVDLAAPRESADAAEQSAPDIISRATVSTGVIRDGILRTGRTLAIARGAVEAGRIDRVSYEPSGWEALIAEGAIAQVRSTREDAAAAFTGARVPVTPGQGAFLDLWVALLDPPTIGRNLLGQKLFTRAVGGLGAGEVALFVGSQGLHSHRGTDWKKSHVFDRIAVVQGEKRYELTDEGYTRVDRLALKEAPEMKERSIFQLGDGFDPVEPFSVEVTATRPAQTGADLTFVTATDYHLPARFVLEPPAPPEPLWQTTWREKRLTVAGVGLMIGLLTLMLFVQEALVARPGLWRGFRYAFLAVTLVWLGWGVNGQLSVVQVVAFLQSLLSGFRWETFLIEPVIFTLWSFVALGLLFWGRGVYCGWLCPFGALQELTNVVARHFGVQQLTFRQALHERLWTIKYTLFIAILALSFYSMESAITLAETEPFKTAISLRMVRAWPFVLFVLAILAAGLFIERFYCRYICPLGAALAIPAKLKIFDWLHRRPQCGRECRLCEERCTVGAIDRVGRINPNECVLCLRCQVIYNDSTTCPTLIKRARAADARQAAIEKARAAREVKEPSQ
ncbi:NosR/NirI family protein [Tropicimonas marinistellae]|uniref:NosR/NirI family protein n=1 Tax=Tropicimonas marinistellae TaxID=1739787 RepID=UPI00098FEC7E|nr:NosR/NirI family protein [Tropicimonas marinistellae]